MSYMFMNHNDMPMIGLKVKLSRYMGMEHHKHVYESGKFKMTIKLFPRFYMKKREDEVYTSVENAFHPCRSIQLLKQQYTFSGEVKIRFQNYEDWDRAKIRVWRLATISSLVGKAEDKTEGKTEAKDNLQGGQGSSSQDNVNRELKGNANM